MSVLATAIVVLVFGPPLIIVPVLLTLLGIGVFAGERSRIVRKAFRCPIKARSVTAEFVVPAGAAHPHTVASCSAFKDPRRVRCAKQCLALAEVGWTPPPGVFGRWALTAGGIAGSDSGLEPARAVPAEAV